MSSTLPPPHVLEALHHSRRSLPKTNLAGLRKWIATTDVGVLIGGDVVLALWEESMEEWPLHFDKPRTDLTTPLGRGFIAFLSAMAEDERSRILKRANDGRVGAKAKGIRFGRKPKLTDHQQAEGQIGRARGQIGPAPGRIGASRPRA
jgi:hypothetical protein